MLYLATQYAWFLLAAFSIGGLMGWIGCTGRMRFSGPLPYVIAAWLLVMVVTGLQGVNGAAALWIETALLYVAAYLVGCGLACLFRTALLSGAPEPVIASEAAAVKPDNVPAAVSIGSPTRSAADVAVAVPQTQSDEAAAPAETAKSTRRKRKKPNKA